jgi:hypothetical protein
VCKSDCSFLWNISGNSSKPSSKSDVALTAVVYNYINDIRTMTFILARAALMDDLLQYF